MSLGFRLAASPYSPNSESEPAVSAGVRFHARALWANLAIRRVQILIRSGTILFRMRAPPVLGCCEATSPPHELRKTGCSVLLGLHAFHTFVELPYCPRRSAS